MMSSYSTDRVSFARELQMLQAQVEVFWHQESPVLTRLGVREAVTILEVGCGPGFFSRKLLDLNASCTLTALDADELMLQAAQSCCDPPQMARVRFLHALAERIPCPDATFDIVIARMLYQHLGEPMLVTNELWRVLKPGGRLIISDIDSEWEPIVYPQIQFAAILTDLLYIQQRLTSQPPPKRHIGRFLWRLLRQQGFHDITLDIIVSHSDDIGLDPFQIFLEPTILPQLQAAESVSEQELQHLLQPLNQFLHNPDALVVAQLFLASGCKSVQ
jgi:ubiquinone/menaquinone biosynthesis C-methylase UbiE